MTVITECSRNALLSALKTALPAARRNSPLPILCNVLIRSHGDRVELTCTSLEEQITVTLEATGEAGTACVNAHRLAEILGDSADGDVRLSMGANNRMAVKTPSGRFTIATIPAGGFPARTPTPDDAPGFTVSAGALRRLLSVHAVAPARDVRYYLMGVHLEPDADGIRSAATDGSAIASVRCTGATRGEFSAIVSKAVAAMLVGMFKSDAAEAAVKLGETSVRVECGDVVIESGLVQGRFPDWRRVIPRDFIGGMSGDRDVIAGALRSAGRIDPSSAVEINSTDTGFTFRAAANGDEAVVDVRAEQIDNPDSVYYSADLLAPGIEMHPHETVRILFGDPKTTNGIALIESPDKDYTYMVAPYRR